MLFRICAVLCNFYPRPPRGGRLTAPFQQADAELFLSTPSARRATVSYGALARDKDDFYPRPPRGGRPRCFFVFAQSFIISIHALREEGDGICPSCGRRNRNFYPRPPRGGRPVLPEQCARHHQNFYPRPPRGGRLHNRFTLPDFVEFLSTPSARRATRQDPRLRPGQDISIHALREEGDAKS